MEFFSQKKKFAGRKSVCYIALLEYAFLAGLSTHSALLLNGGTEGNLRRYITSAIRQGHIRKYKYRVYGYDRNEINLDAYAITAAGVNYLRQHGNADWHNHIPVITVQLQKPSYEFTKAFTRVCIGDAYLFSFAIGATISDFLLCGVPGDLSGVLYGYKQNLMVEVPWGKQINEGEIDNTDFELMDDQKKWSPHLKKGSPSLVAIKRDLYTEWSNIAGRKNELVPSELYYFSVKELFVLFQRIATGQYKRNDETRTDLEQGKFDGILNGQKKSAVVYHAKRDGFGWSKQAGKRDLKTASLYSHNILPIDNVQKSALGVLLLPDTTSFVNTVNDRHGLRHKSRSKPKVIGEGLSAFYGVPLTQEACRCFKSWVWEKTATERSKFLQQEVVIPYGLKKMPVGWHKSPAKKQGEPLHRLPTAYTYDYGGPEYKVFDLSCMDLMEIESLYRYILQNTDTIKQIGVIVFHWQAQYIHSLFSTNRNKIVDVAYFWVDTPT